MRFQSDSHFYQQKGGKDTWLINQGGEYVEFEIVDVAKELPNCACAFLCYIK